MDGQSSSKLSSWRSPALASAHLIVDLASVAHIDSGGMRALVRGHMSVSKQGGRVTLVNVNSNVRRVLHILRLDTVLPVCESIDAALTGLAGD